MMEHHPLKRAPGWRKFQGGSEMGMEEEEISRKCKERGECYGKLGESTAETEAWVALEIGNADKHNGGGWGS